MDEWKRVLGFAPAGDGVDFAVYFRLEGEDADRNVALDATAFAALAGLLREWGDTWYHAETGVFATAPALQAITAGEAGGGPARTPRRSKSKGR